MSSPLDLRLQRHLLRHPALQNAQRIGRGHFCAVYAKPYGDTVLKLSCDRFQYAFYTDGIRPRGPYFPRLVRDFGEVGTTRHEGDELPLFLVEMERLQKIGRSTPVEIKRQARLLQQATLHYDDIVWTDPPQKRAYVRLRAASRDSRLDAAARDAYAELASFAADWDENLSLDIHSENLMRRGGQIVINDPFADSKYT